MLWLSLFRLVGAGGRDAGATLADDRGRVVPELRAPNPIMQVSAIPPALHSWDD